MDKLKCKVQNADWWEIGYLVLYGAIFAFEFLQTTMFDIQWPPRFGYIFLISSALFTVAKFIWHNTYTIKEMIWAGIIVASFCLSGIIADYSFLIWTGFLIVGAKDVDFDKILKVYLTIGIAIMLAAFVASQMGWIENLVYTVWRDDLPVLRNSFGSVFPTDFAAHVFYLSVAGICLSENRLTLGKAVNLIVLAFFVMDQCGARTSFICLIAMAIVVVWAYLFKNKFKANVLYYLINMSIFVFAALYLGLTHVYDTTNMTLAKLNVLLSDRLAITKHAIQKYDYKLFGQYIEEVGFGREVGDKANYFFLDDSYIRIALMYGLVLFVVVLILFWYVGAKAIGNNRVLVICALAVIAMHSFMEHHILEIAYNPLLCYAFAKCMKENS